MPPVLEDPAGPGRTLRSLGGSRRRGESIMTIATLERGARTYVAGHRGLVGGAILRHLETLGFTDLVTRTSSELDLRDPVAVEAFFAEQRLRTVVVAAAKVGGILANNTYPADFISTTCASRSTCLMRPLGTERRSCCSWAPAASTRSSHRSRFAR